MSRTVRMLALILLGVAACRVQAPPAKHCDAVILGACVDRPRVAPVCERGRARNLDDGACITGRDSRALTRGLGGVFVDDGDTIACEAPADELVASSRVAKIGCLELGTPPPECPPRTVREGLACVPIEARGSVDLARWTAAAARAVCASLLRSPAALAAASSTFTVEVTASVPNNDLTQAFVRARAVAGPAGPQDIEAAVVPVDDALRRLSGTSAAAASASEAVAVASCAVSQRRPISVP